MRATLMRQTWRATKLVGCNMYHVQSAPGADPLTNIALAICCDCACNEERSDLTALLVP